MEDVNQTIAEAMKKGEDHKFNPEYNKCFNNNKMAEPIDILKYNEKVNKDAVDYLCNFNETQLKELIYDDCETFNDNGDKFDVKVYIKSVMKFLKEVKENNYTVNRSYKYSQSLAKHKEGRLFVKGFGIQSLQYRLRGFLLNGLCYDYDMKNAHPTLLLNIVKNENNDLDYMFLENYVKHRKKVLDKHQLTKLDILKSINTDKSIRNKNEFLKGFDKEIKQIQEYFYNKYNSKYQTTNKDNPKGSLLNKLLCIEENNQLRKVIDYCIKNDIKIFAPMFDGILINKPGLVDIFNNITKDDGIVWDIKDHDISIVIDEEELQNPYLYKNVKKEFEKEHFIITNPFMYCREYYDQYGKKVLQTFKHTQRRSFEDLTAKFDVEGCGGNKYHILCEWLKDDEKRSYEKIDFLPPPLKCGKNTYNMYECLEYETWKDIEYNEDTNIDNILNHIRLLAGDDKTDECYNYLLHYLSHLIQKPGELPRTSLVFFSDQGFGKNMFWENFGNNILGQQYIKITQDLKNDITGRFADNTRKFITIMGEAQAEQAFKNNDKIKALITDDTINLEQKGKDTIYNVYNTSRLIFFGNTKTQIKIEISDRRFQPIRISCPKPSAEYFNILHRDMNDKSILLKFIDYLKTYDLSKFNFERERIKTSYFEELRQVNIPILARFLQDKFDSFDEDTIKITGTNFYKEFKHYLSRYHREIDYTLTKFGRDIKEYNGIVKKKSHGIMIYTIDRELVIGYLKEKLFYEEVEEEELDENEMIY